MCAAVFALTSCTPMRKDEYAFLNEMLSYEYSEIVLTVTTAFDDDTALTSKYDMTYSDSSVKITYAVERFREISLESGVFSPIETLEGEATIVGGVVATQEGDPVDLSAALAERGFTFRSDYFENASFTGVGLQADVKDVDGFFGQEVDCIGMKIDAFFLDVFYTLTVSYTAADGSRVEYRYEFA